MCVGGSAGVAQARCHAVDGEQQGAGEQRVGLFARGRGFALALEQGDLEVGDGVEVGVADGEGLLEDGGGVEQVLLAGDLEDFGDGAGVGGRK